MKKYLVSPELKPYLRRIMDRRSLDYSFQCADGKDYCNIANFSLFSYSNT